MCSYVFIRRKSRLRVAGWDFHGKGVGMIPRRPPSGYRLYHTMRFLTVLGLAKGDSGPIHRSLENGGFRDPCFATPRDVKAHIAWCGSLLCHTMRFWGVFRLVWHTGWERISRTDG